MDNPILVVVATFVAALIPVLELRAGIPIGLALGGSSVVVTAAAVAGNILQIPVARALVARAYGDAGRIPAVGRWLQRTEAQVMRYAPWIRRWGWLGLTLFVLLPVPGTGVWGGAVLARLLLVPTAGLWLGVGLGIAISGVLLTLSIQGVISLVWG